MPGRRKLPGHCSFLDPVLIAGLFSFRGSWYLGAMTQLTLVKGKGAAMGAKKETDPEAEAKRLAEDYIELVVEHGPEFSKTFWSAVEAQSEDEVRQLELRIEALTGNRPSRGKAEGSRSRLPKADMDRLKGALLDDLKAAKGKGLTTAELVSICGDKANAIKGALLRDGHKIENKGGKRDAVYVLTKLAKS